VDYRIIHPGGEIRDIHAVGHPVLGPSGDLVEFVGSVIDVTERKQAEDRSGKAKTSFVIFWISRRSRLLSLGPDRTRLYVNQAALDYFGLTLEEWRSGSTVAGFCIQMIGSA
jgi:PAS domain-containing protein